MSDKAEILRQAHLLRKEGKGRDAGRLLIDLIKREPDYFDAYMLIGRLALDQKRYQVAEHHYGKATNLKPKSGEAWWNLGLSFFYGGKPDAAAISYKNAMRLEPKLETSNSYMRLAMAHHEQVHLDEAAKCHRKAIHLNQKNARAWMCYAMTLQEQGKHQLALAHAEHAKTIQPTGDHMLLRCYSLLALGREREGWPMYEGRRKAKAFGGPKFKGPEWRAEPGAGRSLCIHREQGAGDVIQFARFAPLCATEFGFDEVFFRVNRNVARLLMDQDWPVRIVGRDPGADVNIHVGSLPAIFNIGLRPVPQADRAYLDVPEKRAGMWRDLLWGMCGDRAKVGLVWAGNPKFYQDQRRSPRLNNVISVAKDLPEVAFVSLQKGDGEEDMDDLEIPSNLHVVSDRIEDFADTAAAIVNLDAIVTSCTSVVHLAGALGKPVFLVIPPYILDWRWPPHLEKSDWYPDVRIYRQEDTGDWPSAVKPATRDLATHLGMNVS